MRASSLAAEPAAVKPVAGESAIVIDQKASFDALSALCAIARLHQIAADPATLAHQLGLQPSDGVETEDLLRAAKRIGLKAKLTSTTPDRLALTALARIRGADGGGRTVVLAQCDGQRVLLQDAATSGGPPTIEPLEAFAQQWTGELVLITSRASGHGQSAGEPGAHYTGRIGHRPGGGA